MRRAASSMRAGFAAAGLASTLAACATAPPPPTAGGLTAGRLADGRPRAYNRPYAVRGRWYTPADQPGYDRVGLASWYSYESSSGRTADGERFDARLATAAHTTLPIPSWLEVTDLETGRSARVRLNDRGPFVAGRIIDLSKAAAVELGMYGRGTARVRVRYLGPAELSPGNRPMWAQAEPPPRPVRLAKAAAPPVKFAAAVPAPAPQASAVDEVREDVADAPVESLADADGPAIVQPAAAPPAPVAPGAATGFAVQAGAFGSRENAERAATRLGLAAGRASVLPLERPDGAVLYRVLLGPWPEPGDAASARARVAALGFADAQVVTR